MTDAITQQSSLRIESGRCAGAVNRWTDLRLALGPLRLARFAGFSGVRQLSIAMALLNITLAIFLRRTLWTASGELCANTISRVASVWMSSSLFWTSLITSRLLPIRLTRSPYLPSDPMLSTATPDCKVLGSGKDQSQVHEDVKESVGNSSLRRRNHQSFARDAVVLFSSGRLVEQQYPVSSQRTGKNFMKFLL